MTLSEFVVIAKLIRSREPVKSAACAVLVDGMSGKDAADAYQVSQQSVSNTVNRIRYADAEIRQVYGSKK